MITLGLEASTYAGTVAVVRDGLLLSARETVMRGEREERLMPAVAGALADAGITPNAIDRVVCGAGPGSFTSLRIAGAIAKGLALAAGVPLIPVPSLLLIVAGAEGQLAPGRYAAVLDAMRGDVFTAVFAVTDSSISPESPTTIVPRRLLDAFAHAHAARAIGPAEPTAVSPHARGIVVLGHRVAWPAPADLATWEPEYGRLAEAQVRWEAAHGRALVPR
jgi:tRNA threonylcarbamoyladenosine biosynthesis protein TsaB